jgi:hypothetical protein
MSGMILPEKALLEAGEIFRSKRAGITKGMFYDAISAGVIKPIRIPGRKVRHKYSRDEIMRVFKLD